MEIVVGEHACHRPGLHRIEDGAELGDCKDPEGTAQFTALQTHKGLDAVVSEMRTGMRCVLAKRGERIHPDSTMMPGKGKAKDD